MKYHVIDLAQIKASLGSHYIKLDEPTYKGKCFCGEDVPQTVNECPYCGIAIVWQHSKVWKAKFGSPQAAIRLLSSVPPDEDDTAGQLLMEKARLDGFANETEKQRWDRARRALNEQRVRGIVLHCCQKRVKGRPMRGRGLIAYALNAVDKAAREAQPKAKPRKPKEPKPVKRTGKRRLGLK